MASSDEEFELQPQIVSDFHFEDECREPISFLALPLQWGENDILHGTKKNIFLSGVVDDGLQKIYKPVTAWKFSLSEAVPQIFTLFKNKNWIKLHKPRKGYGDEIRSIWITIHALHFLRRNPEASTNSLWDHLAKIFSAYDVRPSLDDLADHMLLISEVVKRDEILGKSKFLISYLEGKPFSGKVVEISSKPAFIVDEDDDEIDDSEIDAADGGSDEEDDFFGSICAICDNGGELLCCDGQCMRSFHATKKDGIESKCRSLGFTDEAQVQALQSFICRNCQYNRHQCYCCGKLGSSDKASGAEVFRCVSATCGLFYHPHCVAKVLHHDATSVDEMQAKIAAGESFTCPIHRCFDCQKLEDRNVRELQFALCRRCPKSYHRKCLPRGISFGDEDGEDSVQRAWEGLLPKRILLYCLEHEIDMVLETPIRNHVIFPAIPENKKKQVTMSLSDRERIRLKRSLGSKELALGESSKKPYYENLKQSSSMKIEKRLLPISSNKYMVNDSSRKSLHGTLKYDKKAKSSICGENEISFTNPVYDFLVKGSEPSKLKKQNIATVPSDKAVDARPLTGAYRLDKDSEQRILDMFKQATSSITKVDIENKHRMPSIYASRGFDKNITHGKIEGSVMAVRAALEKLEKGGSIEDAKAVCEPEVLRQLVRWKGKLKVYLAPFLHGVRYTSFGRHFTKVDKLKEIVDRLHCYVKNGDMIVDFCCGANDFSCLMKSKLEETGKKCLYMNYDLLQPKHDFNFVKKDWMTVQKNELPSGSRLIMGLNPPFGVKGSLANRFVDKALEFTPKLIILIVPPETERLDQKRSPYDLVWEDGSKLSGKSFYLPGSVDVHDKQMEQWNVTPPVLSLWSRPDWTHKHIAIALKNNHLSDPQMASQLQQSPTRIPTPQPAPTQIPAPLPVPIRLPPPPPVPRWLSDHKRDNDGDVMMDVEPDHVTRPEYRQLDHDFRSMENPSPSQNYRSQNYSHFNPGSLTLPGPSFGGGYSGARAPRESPIWGNEEHYLGGSSRWRTEPVGVRYGQYGNNDLDIVTRARLYGQQEMTSGSVGSINMPPQSPYGRRSAPSFNRMSGSAIHRYAPRLDEMNHVLAEAPIVRGRRPIYREESTGFPRHPFPYND